jgi:hypothetical protein
VSANLGVLVSSCAVFAALSAGCADLPFIAADVPAGWAPQACDPSGADGISRSAPLVAGLQQPPEAIAADVADLVGDGLAARTNADERFPAWATLLGGSVRLSILPSGSFFMAVYEGPAGVDRFVVQRLLERWGVDLHTVWMGNGLLVEGDTSDGPAFQMAVGHPVAWANGGATWSSGPTGSLLTVLPFYEVPAAAPAVAEEDALRTGAAFGRCHLESKGLTPTAGYHFVDAQVMAVGSLHESLGYIVSVRSTSPAPTACGDHREWVYVDVGTGAVLGSHAEPCVKP